MTLPPEVQQAISELPGADGWWHSSGQEDFEGIATDLLAAGLGGDAVLDILGRAFGAVANEYGN